MIFPQAVLEAVLTITSRTANADGVEGVDIGLTAWMRALRSSQESRLAQVSTVCSRGKPGSFPPCRGPLAGARAFVSCFGAVVETVGTFTGFAAEGEEIELVAVGVLAVGSNRFEVFVHASKCLGVGRW